MYVRKVNELTIEALPFFNIFWELNLEIEKRKAFHILSGEFAGYLVSAIFKFVYIDDKSVLWNRKQILRKNINPVYVNGIHSNEPLPKAEAKAAAKQKNFE